MRTSQLTSRAYRISSSTLARSKGQSCKLLELVFARSSSHDIGGPGFNRNVVPATGPVLSTTDALPPCLVDLADPKDHFHASSSSGGSRYHLPRPTTPGATTSHIAVSGKAPPKAAVILEYEPTFSRL
jgi:hypothetical protein